MQSSIAMDQQSCAEYKIIGDVLPENYRMIHHTSYTEIKQCVKAFVKSKRHTRDAENVDTFLKSGTRSDCARVDAIYAVRDGSKSHIDVQNKEDYWAEQEKLFPYLKQAKE